MKIRRNVASVPARSAQDTWHAIVELVTGPDTLDRQHLDAAASIMESLIADEHPVAVPIVFKGAGHRVVIYCLYDQAALDAGLDVDSLTTNPTAGDWRATAPCDGDDVGWMTASLGRRAPRITVHAVHDIPAAEPASDNAIPDLHIDWATLEKS